MSVDDASGVGADSAGDSGGGTQAVRLFFEAMEARDWDTAGSYLSDDLVIEFTETGERFQGGDFLAMNRAYPEGWSIDVVEIIEAGNRVAAQVRVDLGEDVFWCAGFYTVDGGVIRSGVEHWVTAGSEQPPEWRKPFVS